MKMCFKSLIITIMIGISSFLEIKGCIITFTNDSSRDIRVRDVKKDTIFDMKKNKSRRFGNPHERVHIKIYEKQSKNGVFVETFDVQQMQCSHDGNPRLSYSQLKNKTGEANLFSINKNTNPHKPMVQTIPIRTTK